MQIGDEMVPVEAATFVLGRSGSSTGHDGAHRVGLTRDLVVGATEVTQDLYAHVIWPWVLSRPHRGQRSSVVGEAVIRSRDSLNVAVLSLCVAGVMFLGGGCGKRAVYSKQEVLDSNWVVPDSPVSSEVENSSTETSDHVEYFLSPQPVIDLERQLLTVEVREEVTRTQTDTRTIAETFRHELHERTRRTTKYTDIRGGGGIIGAGSGGTAAAMIWAGMKAEDAQPGAIVALWVGSVGLGTLIGFAIEAAASSDTRTSVTEEVVDTKLVTDRSPQTRTQEDVVSRALVDSVDVGVESDFLSEGSMVLRPSNGVLTIPFELGYPYVLADGDVDAASRVSRHLTAAGCRSASSDRVQSYLQTVVLPLRVWTMSGNAAETQEAEGMYKIPVFRATEGVEAAAGCR